MLITLSIGEIEYAMSVSNFNIIKSVSFSFRISALVDVSRTIFVTSKSV